MADVAVASRRRAQRGSGPYGHPPGRRGRTRYSAKAIVEARGTLATTPTNSDSNSSHGAVVPRSLETNTCAISRRESDDVGIEQGPTPQRGTGPDGKTTRSWCCARSGSGAVGNG